MAPIPKDVMSALAAQTNLEQAVDILEEHVVHRRAKGDSLYEVSASLADLQTRVRAVLSQVFQDRTPMSSC